MKLEKELMKQVEQRMGIYQITGEVEFYVRLNAGTVKTYYGSYVKLAPKDTPDYMAIIRNNQDGLTILFLECKSDTGKLTKGQIEFSDKYNKKNGFVVMELRDIKDLDKFIIDNSKDFVALI